MSGGTSGDDTLNGSAGADTLDGQSGNDSISSNGGNDSVSGGTGNDTISGGAGNDTLLGGEGNDSISAGEQDDDVTGGDGNDTIEGGGGADSISGGDGDDEIDGGNQNDTIDAGEGNDTVLGGYGSDEISTGSGNDSVDGGNDSDTISAGSGSDTIEGGSGADSIQGGADDDSMDGGNDNDTIRGDQGDDTIEGGAGNDSIVGGSGADSIDGGDHEDTVDGGSGDDTLSGGANDDIFIIRDGNGNDVIADFTPGEDRIAFDMDEVNNFTDLQSRLSEDGSDSVITFDNGDTVTLSGVSNAELTTSHFMYTAGPVCLLEGTPIRTIDGYRPIEKLRAGDLILSKDSGWKPLKFLVAENLRFHQRDDPAKPILIPAGSLGSSAPNRDIVSSPQHRFLRLLPGSGTEVLVPVVKLVGKNGIRRMRGKKSARYYNLVFDKHCIVQAAGCWVESLLVNAETKKRTGRRDIVDLCSMELARPVVRRL